MRGMGGNICEVDQESIGWQIEDTVNINGKVKSGVPQGSVLGPSPLAYFF